MHQSESERVRGRPVSLDELILLNEELQALLAAGVPLEVGLRGSSGRLKGRLGRLAERLAMRIEQGATLEGALEEERENLPAEYRAVVAAGFRSGSFDAVLASITGFASAMRELRSHVARALVYPSAVLIIAYILFVVVVVVLVPAVAETYETFRLESTWWLRALSAIRSTVRVWGPLIPVAAMLLLVFPWLWRRFAGSGRIAGWQLGVAGAVPGVGGIVRSAELARFSHLLSILVEHRVPFPEAARLSAAATGSDRLVREIERTVEGIESGRPLAQALPEGKVIPPFLRWLMIVGDQQSALPAMLRQAAEVYQQRAVFRAEWIQRVLPVTLVFVLGGAATVLYALAVFLPMAGLWRNLGT